MNAVLSPRFRYRYLPRILWVGGGLAIAALVVFGITRLFPSKDLSTDPGKLSDKPAQVVHTDNTNFPVPAAVTKIAGQFVNTTVTRDHLNKGWALLAPCGVAKLPCLHQDISHGAWVKGNIPVVPYPAYGGAKF